ncbi:MAG: hypothetical protein KDA52_05675 [Planctomycetaceae bacterium]|nr:hypothetical protein [Planctomycetaceae bacterium]
MKQPELLDVDPAELRLPGGRIDGADPAKLLRQISRHGDTVDDMPNLLVTRDVQGCLILNDGVTRATRIAKLRPGTLLTVEVIDEVSVDLSSLPTIREKLP